MGGWSGLKKPLGEEEDDLGFFVFEEDDEECGLHDLTSFSVFADLHD